MLGMSACGSSDALSKAAAEKICTVFADQRRANLGGSLPYTVESVRRLASRIPIGVDAGQLLRTLPSSGSVVLCTLFTNGNAGPPSQCPSEYWVTPDGKRSAISPCAKPDL